MNIHVLGICGKFMSGIALMAQQRGHQVCGSDQHCLPPMSTQLEKAGIQLYQDYLPEHLQPAPDCVIVGNALSRGNPAVEYMLNQRLRFTSAPQWLAEHIIDDKWVIAVSGTHGKTTTTSMIAWILHYAGLNPGFLVGGVPNNFGYSARLTDSEFFVIEADEYDTAFFDKRPKFIHFHPQTLLINNIEFDHADIYPDIAAIKQQFHYLVRTVPGNGQIIYPQTDKNVADVLQRGCWSEKVSFAGRDAVWHADNIGDGGGCFDVYKKTQQIGTVNWSLIGAHNINNALAAIAAATHVGVIPEQAIAALAEFSGVKQRMEIKGVVNDITIYEDFAHHPTAIATTLEGLRRKLGDKRIIAVAEFASNTMQAGHHKDSLPLAFNDADAVIFLQLEQANWNLAVLAQQLDKPAQICADNAAIIQHLWSIAQPGDHIVFMSNKGFGGIHQQFLDRLT